MSDSPEAIDTGRRRVRQLFRFLEAYNQKKNPIATRITDQSKLYWWRDLPQHPKVKAAEHSDDNLDSDADPGQKESEAVLLVERADVPQPPELPASLLGWIDTGWEDPRRKVELIDEQPRPDGGFEYFDDDPARREALARWSSKRDTWAVSARSGFEVNELFSWLFDVYSEMEREAERHELVLGDGILSWANDDGGVNYPILLQRLQLRYDPRVPAFIVSEAERPPELNASLLRRARVDGKVISELTALAEELQAAPLGADRTTGFFHTLIATISPEGQFVENGGPTSEKAYPQIGRDPVIFLRSRAQGFEAAISNILEDLENDGEIPDSLLSIVGVHEAVGVGESEGALEQADEASDVLLSKEANREQLEIARRLSRYGAVRVQGPPGTGKTHTIANLLGHLLAEGKSALVTSHTTKALRVLREKVVRDLQPLCVSVLEGDATSRAELSDSVARISDRLSSSAPEDLERQAEELRRRRDTLVQRVRTLRDRLLAAVTAEYSEVVLDGRTLTTEQAATTVADGVGVNDWIPGTLSGQLPLTVVEISSLYSTNEELPRDAETQLLNGVPDPATIPTPQHFADLATRLREVASFPSINLRTEVWSPVPRSTQDLSRLAEVGAELAASLSARPEWYLRAVAASASGPLEAEPWKRLLVLLQEAATSAGSVRRAYANFGAQLGGGLSAGDALSAIGEMLDHLARGQSFTWWATTRHPSWRRILGESSCAGAPPWSSEKLDALAASPRSKVSWLALCEFWPRLMGTVDLPGSSEQADEQACLEMASSLIQAIGFREQRIEPLVEAATALGLDVPRVLPMFGALIPRADDWRELAGLLNGEFQEIIAAEVARVSRADINAELQRMEAALAALPNAAKQGSPAGELRRAVLGLDENAYLSAHAQVVELDGRGKALARRLRLLAALERSAPEWADAIRLRVAPHDRGTPPGDVRAAWEWGCIDSVLRERCGVQLDQVIAEIEITRSDLRTVTAQLIDRLAWARQIRRTLPEQRVELALWLNTVKKIGKGSGRNVPRLQRAARDHMAAAVGAVPVWIAPLTRVAESFDARNKRFDVVVIDEASQCDVLGLIALYMGRQVIVVGDDQQVTPDAVGDRIDTSNDLIDTFLQGIPGAQLYDGQYSIYEQAAVFGGAVKLREHFRCVPDIIRFSSSLSYNWEIVPLRDVSDASVRPSVVSHRVDSGGSDGRVNREEALHVASLIAAACEQPEYTDASFGAISLLGAEQARAIELLLRNHMSLAEYERRRILCGTPPQFQGDERDVVFLSMVDVPGDGPLRMVNEGPREMYKKRYNVAASRARDQLWVVHSLDPARDLRPGDLRWRLLEFARNPSALKSEIDEAQARAESPLESGVIRELVTEGFHVVPQFQVGGYRIDLVVGDERNRVAVECDGDRYHTSENLQQDLDRQALLERMGWRFIRIRGSEYFREPGTTIKRVIARLEQLGVGRGVSDSEDGAHVEEELIERVRRRAAELRQDWSRGSAGGRASSNEDSRRPSYAASSSDPRELKETGDTAVDPSPPTSRNASPAVDVGNQIRSVTGEAASTNDRFAPYEEAELSRFPISGPLSEESDRNLHPMVMEVVGTEAPLHFETLLERLRRRYGIARAKELTRGHVLRSVVRLSATGAFDLVRRDAAYDAFLVQPDVPTLPRLPGITGLRRPEHIAPAEFTAGLLAVLRRTGPSYRDDWITATAREFGFRRTSDNMYAALDSAIQELLLSKQVEESFGRLQFREDVA